MIHLELLTLIALLHYQANSLQEVTRKIGLRNHVQRPLAGRHIVKDKNEQALTVNSLLSLYDFEGDDDMFVTRKNVFGVAFVMVANTAILMLTIWQTSRLFSKGLGKKYMNGGGWWLLLSALIGNLFGCFIGYVLVYSVLILGFSFMLLAVSFLLVGRRGMIIGAISGLEIGVIFGTIHSGSTSAMITEGMLCSFAGVAIGFIPMFPNIKINSRYIQKSLRSINSIESQLQI